MSAASRRLVQAGSRPQDHARARGEEGGGGLSHDRYATEQRHGSAGCRAGAAASLEQLRSCPGTLCEAQPARLGPIASAAYLHVSEEKEGKNRVHPTLTFCISTFVGSVLYFSWTGSELIARAIR